MSSSPTKVSAYYLQVFFIVNSSNYSVVHVENLDIFSILFHLDKTSTSLIREAGMAQWWECSPPTNVAYSRFNSSLVPYVGWVCCRFEGKLAPRVFSEFSGFSLSTKMNISKFKFGLYRGPPWKPATADVASSPNIVISFHFISRYSVHTIEDFQPHFSEFLQGTCITIIITSYHY